MMDRRLVATAAGVYALPTMTEQGVEQDNRDTARWSYCGQSHTTAVVMAIMAAVGLEIPTNNILTITVIIIIVGWDGSSITNAGWGSVGNNNPGWEWGGHNHGGWRSGGRANNGHGNNVYFG